MKLSFGAAQRYLQSTINEGLSPREPYRLERMSALARELGDPQSAYPTIHVGGTSGKGSTSMFIAAALQARGLRVGLHTKPHLRSVTERARINGIDISEAYFGALLETMFPAIECVTTAYGRPSYYETTLALALLYYARERVDAAVIEVGLGGRLDGTNILLPEVAVITSIGFDHMDVLGDSLAAIAAEKAGIAKPGIPLVVAVDNAEARAVIAAQAQRVGAPIVWIEDAQIDVLPAAQYAQCVRVRTQSAAYDLALPVLGAFQRRNAAVAILALETLPDTLQPSVAEVEAGFARVQIPGRMEFFPGAPAVIFDIAHNAAKAENLAFALREHFPDRRMRFVIAIGESKDAREVLRAFADFGAHVTTTTFNTDGRSARSAQRLLHIAQSLDIDANAIDDPIVALEAAFADSANDDIVVVTGSTFIVAQLRAWWLDRACDSPVAQR